MSTVSLSASAAVSVRASASLTVTRPRIKRISISGYRAFPPYKPTSLEIDLGDTGKNLLLYGENGSGKTSLFRCLRDLFDISPRARDYAECRNIFQQADDDSISVEFTQGTPSEFRWDHNEEHPKLSGGDSFQTRARSILFLDYRDLLQTNFVHRTGSPNLFDLLTTVALADLRVPSRKLGEVASSMFRSRPPGRQTKNPVRRANSAAGALCDALTNHLPEVVREANRLLGKLQSATEIGLKPPDSIIYRTDSRSFEGCKVLLNVRLNGSPDIAEPQHFLNEARLTSIALALYLAAARIVRSGRPGIMVLDDVLIGLDLSNRIPLLRLLNDEFSDWQILLFTHDHVWFELAREYTEKSSDWAHRELMLVPAGPNSAQIPEIKDSTSALERANAHLDGGDKMAAAVYLRAAFEARLRNVCEKKGVEVVFKKQLKEVKADALWTGILNRQEQRNKLQQVEPHKNHPDFIGSDLISKVEMMRSTILNRLSHTESPTFERSEIETARDTITELQNHPFPNKNV